MAMTCGQWLFTQEVRSAKHWREVKGTKGVFNVYELKVVAGVSSYIVGGEGVDNICGIRAFVLWTLLAVAQGVWQLCG